MGKKRKKRKVDDIKMTFRCKNLSGCVNCPKLSKRQIRQDSLVNQKRDYLGLAKKFHVPISYAIEHYDTLSKPDT